MPRAQVVRERGRLALVVDGAPDGTAPDRWVDAAELRERWPRLGPVLDRMWTEHAEAKGRTPDPPHRPVD